MKQVLVNELRPDMVLARDVYSRDNGSSIFLLKRGEYLTQENIDHFAQMGVLYVYIKDGQYDDVECYPALSREQIRFAIDEIKSFYEKHKISSLSVGVKDMASIEKVCDMLIEQVLTKPTLSMSMKELKSYDDYTYHHSLSVACLALIVAKGLGYDEEKMRKLGLSAILHDIGKTMLDVDLVNKPGKLTDSEYALMKKHTTYGGEYLKKHQLVDFDIYNGVITHHEKFDGTGYPFGLGGGNIPEFGRVIAVCDVYDALTSNRSYRDAWSIPEAYEYIIGGSGTFFDESIVEAFKKMIVPYPIGSMVRLSNGDKGLVVHVEHDMPLRPVIQDLKTGDFIYLNNEQINIVIKGFAEDESITSDVEYETQNKECEK